MDVEVTLPRLLALMAAAFFAGLMDAIAGGGGLITVPALLAAGLSPHHALATNKGQSAFGSFAALIRFSRAGMIDWRRGRRTFPLGFCGSLVGAGLVLLLKPELLRPIVLVLLVAVAAFLALRPPVAHPEGHPPPPRAGLWAAVIALACGVYDGFFGPGTGTFLIVGLVGLVGLPLARASAEAKVVNFASNLGAMLVFGLRGMTVWRISLPMAGACLFGGFVGAHLAVKGGDRFVRWAVLSVVVALVVKQGFALYSGG